MAERACVQRLQKEFRALCKVRVVSDDAWERDVMGSCSLLWIDPLNLGNCVLVVVIH